MKNVVFALILVDKKENLMLRINNFIVDKEIINIDVNRVVSNLIISYEVYIQYKIIDPI